MKSLINKYKKMRKLGHIKKKFAGSYAFVGIGNHSINNLYPVLNYLNVDLKYIVSGSKDTADAVSKNYEGIKGTNNLSDVLNDDSIKGVFICANPGKHFNLIKQCLESNKNVFAEKPPCENSKELDELIDAEEKSKGTALIGLQKRYAPLYRMLKARMKDPVYYNYKYFTGSYPEGDPLFDLFIHPVDVVTNLFGEAKILSLQNMETSKGVITKLIHLKHNSGVRGNMELSTDFWWAKAKENMFVNSKKYIYEAEGTSSLTRIDKPSSIMSIPLEKIKKPEINSKILFDQNSFLPVMEHNQLYTSGYYDEILSFLNICDGKSKDNISNLKAIKPTFKLLTELNK